MLAYDMEDLPDTFEKIPRPRKQQQHLTHYPLDELFSGARMADKLTLAEGRIVEVFTTATEIRRGRSYPTRGYIGAIGKTQKELVAHVITNSRRFVTVSELSKSVPYQQLKIVARRAEKDLVSAKVAQLVQKNDVWFNEYATGIWEIRPSLIDKYELDRELVRLIRKTDQQIRREHLHGDYPLRAVH